MNLSRWTYFPEQQGLAESQVYPAVPAPIIPQVSSGEIVPADGAVQFPKAAWHPAVVKQYSLVEPQKPLTEQQGRVEGHI
jgi:hypothetical protein